MCHNTSFQADGQSISSSSLKLCKGGALSEQDESKSYLETDKNSSAFQRQLRVLGLEIRDIAGDGNCLFRALADQLDGQSENHSFYREKVCEYIQGHRTDFEPFLLQDDRNGFDEHVKLLRQPGTYAGNDAIFGFAQLFRVDIVIHQLNRPIVTISHCNDDGEGVARGGGERRTRQLHISYHNNEHYASVRLLGDGSSGPTKFFTTTDQNNDNTILYSSMSCYSTFAKRKLSEETFSFDPNPPKRPRPF